MPDYTLQPRRSSVAKRFLLTLFMSIFLAFGTLFTGLTARDAVKDTRTRRWPRVTCTILRSGIKTEDRANARYRWAGEYTWESGGRNFTGSTYRRGYDGSDDYAAAQQIADRFPVGSRPMCLMNPSDPAEAVLEPRSLWHAATVAFGLVFLAIPVGVLWAAWRRKRPQSAGSDSPPNVTRRRGAVAGMLFCAVLAAAGAGFGVPFFVLPLWRTHAARAWPQVPCRIISSAVRTHPDSDDGDTYSVDVLYAYQANGREYRSNRYNFFKASTSGYKGKARIAARYQPGSTHVCYVNPADPSDAVLSRDVGGDVWFGIIPLVFVLFGVGGMVGVARASGKTAPAPTVPQRPPTAPALPRTGPLVLKAKSSPGANALTLLIVGLFWNGIAWFMVWKLSQDWRGSHGVLDRAMFGILPLVILAPVALVGVFLLVLAGYFALASRNPRAQLTLSAAPLIAGEQAEVRWELSGRYDTVQRLTLSLEGREETTTGTGEDARTTRRTFATIPVMETARPAEIRSGRKSFSSPPNGLPSGARGNRRIIWYLVIRGEIPHWPDLKQEFEVHLAPGAGA